MERYYESDDMHDIDYPDRDWLPTWLTEPRGFIDKRTTEAKVSNSILDLHLPGHVSSWEKTERGWTFRLGRELTIEIRGDATAQGNVVATSNSLNRKWLDYVRAQLRSVLRNDLTRAPDSIEFTMILLRLAEEGVASLKLWREAIDRRSRSGPMECFVQSSEGCHEPDDNDWKAAVLNSLSGVNISTTQDMATELLGKSIQAICSDIPDWLRVLHVEPVFREDLVKRFVIRREHMLRQLSALSYNRLRECVSPSVIRVGSSQDNVDRLAEELASPRVTFHGSPRSNIASIVRYGFVKPGGAIGGTGRSVVLRRGASYGVGVYSSPDPLFASHYASYVSYAVEHRGASGKSGLPGMRLFVCATLMGRPVRVKREMTHRSTVISDKIANSHISPDGLEYIVFDPVQILPVYVLHLDYGAARAREEFYKISKDPVAYFQKRKHEDKSSRGLLPIPSWPGDVQEKKAALKAAAKKWFPYGYGPARGESFIIEEIGYVSDDEEDYGDYQYMRNEQEDEIRLKQRAIGGNWFDEYQTVRTSMKDLGLK